jgi:phosphoribosyl 1,2-cyclic phosphodiesterase
MKLKVLGSSSKGNCYILETPTGNLLLDAGVPFKEIQKALKFNLSGVRGCLVTHEHGDHSKAVKDVVKSGIDVYASKGTIEAMKLNHHRLWIVQSSWPGYQFTIGDFTILPFKTEHDAADPVGYLVQYIPTGEKLLFATDTYYLRYRFQKLNYILVECNYCPDILKANIESGSVPQTLANRLLESHFSLENVKGFMEANDLSEVRKIVLIHLSDGNSDAARMKAEIEQLTSKDVEVAEAGKEIDLELYPF